MARTRMNNAHRAVLKTFAEKKINEVVDRKEEKKLLKKIITMTNTAIRKKFPEEEIKILKKHELAVVDNNIKYVFPSGRIDGHSFDSEDELAETPYEKRFSSNRPPFPMSEEFENILDSHNKIKEANDIIWNQKWKDCRTLIEFAKYVEDVLEVIKVPKDIEYSLIARSTALVALAPDVIARIQKDFMS